MSMNIRWWSEKKREWINRKSL